MDDNKDQLGIVQEYRELVLIYEALDEKIDNLIMANDGVTENMSDIDFKQYRKLATERAEILNEMRILEHQLNLNIDDE